MSDPTASGRSDSPPGGEPNRRRLLGGGAAIAIVAVAVVAAAIVVGPLSGGARPSPSPTPAASLASMPRPTSVASPAATPPPASTSSPAAGTPAPSSAGSSPSASPAGTVATRIVIARLGIDLPIVEGDGVDAPLDKAAHFPGSAWPGGGSNIYLYGHAREGMFIGLWKAKAGDEVDLTLRDGSTRRYTVTKILADVAWNDLSVLDPTPTEQLTLQTCTSYEDTAPRFVVIAEPAP